MNNFNKTDNDWMQLALTEAEKAMEFAEIPVASILVGGDKEITRSQTMVRRKGSIAAHGELFALLEAKGQIWSADRPLVIYTTLEPCLMCLGACIQAGVDKVVYGMKAAPDGGARFVSDITKGGQTSPEVVGGLMEEKSLDLMKRFLELHPSSPAIPYVKAMIEAYS
jgi:tRNA(adenine34) deaminase